MGANTKYKDSVFTFRLLMYIARVYEKTIGDKNIYSTRLVPIPRPEFFVLYNAVIYCRDNDILKGFLEQNGTEVMNMLMTEWNWDDALAVRFEEGLEEGMEKGRDNERKYVLELLGRGLSPEEVKQCLMRTVTGNE